MDQQEVNFYTPQWSRQLSQPEKIQCEKRQPAKKKDRRVATVRYLSQRRERKRSK
jgi:hypothetical protein